MQAAFFGCEHNVDKSGHAVVVNKTPLARIPEIRFKEWIPDDIDLAGRYLKDIHDGIIYRDDDDVAHCF